MKKSFFLRIYIFYCIMLFVSVVFVEWYITNAIRSNHLIIVKNSLTSQINLISNNISFTNNNNFDELCKAIKNDTGAIVTLINLKGVVLCDSDIESSLMDNQANNPEIQMSLHSEIGWSIRQSSSRKDNFLFVAKKTFRNSEHDGFIRLSLSIAEINNAITALRLKINIAVIFILLTLGAILILPLRRIRKFVDQVSDYAGALAHGLFRKRPSLMDAGEFTDISESLDDIALELKSNLDKINEETNRLNVILRSIPDALLLIDTDNLVQIANNRARELFSNLQLDGKPLNEVVQDPDLLLLIDNIKQTRMPASSELNIDYPEERHFLVQLSPLFYKVGIFAGIVAIFHDITDFIKLEQVRKDFVANVSHEIKTPVTAIKGFAETLLDGALHDRNNAEKFLKTIKSHSERLNRLVEDLLTLSKIELGVTKIHKAAINISDIIDNTIQIMVVRAAEKEIAIKKQLGSARTINADRDRTEQILLNLIDNAIKFTKSGEIVIGTSQEDGNNYFFVRDTGIGIPEKNIPRLGERFFRVDPSRSRELGGTGLGLAIVKHLVIAHGWEMSIESNIEKGTIVKIFYS